MKPISLVLQPSYHLAALLIVMAVLSCISIGFAPIAMHISITLGMLIVFATVYFVIKEALLLLPRSWRMVEVNYQGQLILTNLNGERFNASARINGYVVRYLVILHFDQLEQTADINPINDKTPFKQSWLKQLMMADQLNSSRLILLPDSINQQDFRHLRVWLRWWQHNHTVN